MDDKDNNNMQVDDNAAVDDNDAAPPTLSKAWAVAKQHVPTFTGGKITHSKRGLPGNKNKLLDIMLLPVAGDVAVVDAQHGVTLGTLRGGQGQETTTVTAGNLPHDEEDDDLEDDELDVDAITAYALSHNDQVVVTCSHNNMMRQYHLTQPQDNDDAATAAAPTPVAQLVRVWGKSGHTLPVTQMEFHLSSVFLATGSVDGTVRVWDCRSPKAAAFLTHLFQRPRVADAAATIRGSVTTVAWYPDHSVLQLAIGRDDGTLVIHDLHQQQQGQKKKGSHQSQQQPMAILTDHDAAVTACDWLPQQRLFISASRDAVVNVWSMTNGRKGVTQYTRIHTLPVYEQLEGLIVLRPTQQRPEPAILTAGSKGVVRLWHVEPNENGRLQLWKEQPAPFGQERGGYLQMCYHPTYDTATQTFGKEQVIVADAEHSLSFLSLQDSHEDDDGSENNKLLACERTMVGHNDDILDIKVLPNQRIAVATNSPQVRIFDLDTFSCRVLEGHSATVLAVDVSPCGSYLATCGKDHLVRLWHSETSRCVAVAVGHAEAVGSTALSRKPGKYTVTGKAAKNGGGSFMVSVSIDRTLKRWNLPGSEELDRIAQAAPNDTDELSLHASISVRAHEKDINIVSVAPNDSLVATGSQDKTVKIWKASDLSLVATLTGHRRGIWDCQFSPHDRILATASGDKTIKLWSLGDFGCVRTFQGHVASVLRVRFLNGGLQMVSSSADALVKVWTIRTNECETTLDGHTDKVWALDLAQGGKQLISGGADSKIVLWNDTTVEVEESKRAEEEEAIQMDQKLANHLRRKEYGKALEISLQRDKPQHALRVFTAIIEADVQKGKDGIEPLQVHARSWNEDRLLRVLQYCRDWNTKARNCHVALVIVKAVVTCIPVHTLAAMKGVPEVVSGIMSYAERHFERLDKLYGSSYLLDFALSAMGDLESSNDYDKWEATRKLVLPPKQVDGRIQVGGMAIVGRTTKDDESDDEVMTVGDSDSSDDEANPLQRKSDKPPAAAVSDKSESSSESDSD